MLSGRVLRTLTTATTVAVSGILLAGCASKETFGTYTGGACDGFPRPEYQIKGATVYDQKWSDKVIEAGVQGCKWNRPEARPSSLDAKPMVVKAPVKAEPRKATFRERFLGVR